MKLAPIPCASCGAPLPLAAPVAELRCPHCGQLTALPPAYVHAAEQQQHAAEARRRAEPLWRALGAGPPAWAAPAGLAALVLLPPLATLLAWLWPGHALGAVEITAQVTLPALLPGAALWLWTGAVAVTTTRFQAALAARPPASGGPPRCRTCGAPLAVEPDALAATCGYCGADSVLQELPTTALAHGLSEAITTLADATRRLRARRLILGLGALAVTLLVAGSSTLLWIALLHVS